MRVSDLRSLSDPELEQREGELREELFRLRLRHGTAQLEGTAKLGQTRREIARIRTLLRERVGRAGSD